MATYYRTATDGDFERIIKVYTSAGAVKYANLSAYCEHCEFTLSAERGCGAGVLRLIPRTNGDSWVTTGDRVELIPETGGDPWYYGIVGARRKLYSVKPVWEITLFGVGQLLEGLPSAEEETILGVQADGENPEINRIYVVGDNLDGIVWWLYTNRINAELDDIHGENIDDTFQVYTSQTQIQYLKLGADMDCANALIDLARINEDLQSSHSENPYPAIWGVDAARYFYYGFRPDNQLLFIRDGVLISAGDKIGKPSVYLGSGAGTLAKYDGYSEENDGLYYNVLMLYGSVDENGEQAKYTYEDEDSITKYGMRRVCRYESPTIANSADATKFANTFFDRYADPVSVHTINGLLIPSKDLFPFPWLGHCAIETATQARTSELAKRTIRSLRVEFNETPVCSMNIGEVAYTDGLPADGNSRSPGNVHNEIENRRPKTKEAAATVSSGTGDGYWHWRIYPA